MTIQTALQQGKQLLEQAGVSAPRLTAEVLLSHAIRCERQWLVAHSTDELKEVWWIHYGRYLHERMEGKPTQYITKRQEFYGREFRITPDVLIPRPETEHVVEAVLTLAAVCVSARVASPAEDTRALTDTAGTAFRILDIGTGSGAIAITLALESRAHVTAADISPAALAIARANGRRLQANVDWVLSDLASAFATESFDMVVSNPPYVAKRDQETLQREVRDFEPALALYGGEDGLAIYRRLIPEVWRILKPGGWLVLEIGAEQGVEIMEMLSDWGQVEIQPDLAALPRVLVARR